MRSNDSSESACSRMSDIMRRRVTSARSKGNIPDPKDDIAGGKGDIRGPKGDISGALSRQASVIWAELPDALST